MDESTDAISKDCGHQLLKCRGCVAITHLHYLASEHAKYCGKHRLMDVFWYNAYLFVRIFVRTHICSYAYLFVCIFVRTHICSYALDILSFERYATQAISLRMISWSGNGVMSLTMLSFCSRKSKTVRSLPFFFGMQSIGTA